MAETLNAWPFLIGRGRNAGYRVVVVPDFMADDESTSALSAATGTVQLPADAACIRELRGLASGPVSVVYRSFNPRGADFGLSDRGELTDGFGRLIRVTEGFVVRAAIGAAPLEVSVADLERAHAEAAGAYRDFWQQDQGYQRRTAGPYPLGPGASAHHSSPPVQLVAATPWTREPLSLPEDQQPTDTSALISTLIPRALDDVPVPRQPAARQIRLRQVLTAAVVVIGLVLVAAVLNRELRGKPTSPIAAVLGDFCTALTSGQPDAAYSYTTKQFRSSLPSTLFARELLSGAAKADKCTYTLGPSTRSEASGTVTITAESATPAAATTWKITLAHAGSSPWLISTLSPQ